LLAQDVAEVGHAPRRDAAYAVALVRLDVHRHPVELLALPRPAWELVEDGAVAQPRTERARTGLAGHGHEPVRGFERGPALRVAARALHVEEELTLAHLLDLRSVCTRAGDSFLRRI